MNIHTYIPEGKLSPKNTTSGFMMPSLQRLHGTGVVSAKRCSGTTMSPSGRSFVFVELVSIGNSIALRPWPHLLFILLLFVVEESGELRVGFQHNALVLGSVNRHQ